MGVLIERLEGDGRDLRGKAIHEWQSGAQRVVGGVSAPDLEMQMRSSGPALP